MSKLFYKDLGIFEGKGQLDLGREIATRRPSQGLRDFLEEVTLQVKPNGRLGVNEVECVCGRVRGGAQPVA